MTKISSIQTSIPAQSTSQSTEWKKADVKKSVFENTGDQTKVEQEPKPKKKFGKTMKKIGRHMRDFAITYGSAILGGMVAGPVGFAIGGACGGLTALGPLAKKDESKDAAKQAEADLAKQEQEIDEKI